MKVRLLTTATLALVAGGAVFSQSPNLTPPNAMKFEAVTVKRNKSDSQAMYIPLDRPGGHVTAVNCTLRFLISVAYDLPFFTPQAQRIILNGPKWIDSEHFDLEAEKPGNPPESDKELMLRSLLRDQFHLIFHHETRQLPALAITRTKTGRMGPQLQPASPNAKCQAISPSPAAISDDATPPCNSLRLMYLNGVWHLFGDNISIAMIAKELTYNTWVGIDRAVVDSTGLTDNFDVDLRWASETDSKDSDAPTIFTAVQEQLGLRLQPSRGSVDVLVIDDAEDPSPN